MAALNCFAPVVRELLIAGADPNIVSSNGKMPLDILPAPGKGPVTLETDGVDIVYMLIRTGASEKQRMGAIDRIKNMRRAENVTYFSPLLRALEERVGVIKI